MGTFRIEEFETSEATDGQLRDVNVLNNLINKESLPDDPPTPDEEYIAETRSQLAETRTRIRHRLMRGEGGKVVGFRGTGPTTFPRIDTSSGWV